MFGLFNTTPSITTNAFTDKLTQNVILLDVRTSQEYRTGHIANAQNIPLNKITTYQGNKEEPIYLICQSGMRSKQAVKTLKKNGYHAINVRGGMNAWTGPTRGGK
ncbi:MAG: rhodanese-like domain-containing protein [Enterococcus sp.]